MKHLPLLLSLAFSLSLLTVTAQENDAILDSIAVPYTEAKRMVDNYAPKAGQVLLPGGDTESDTRVLWFSVDVLKALLQHVDAVGGDGIRFYLAAYSDTYPDGIATRIPPMEYWGRNTLLMVPTREMVDAEGYSYHEDRFEGFAASSDVAANRTSGRRAFNDAGMCPPPKVCKGATLLQ